MGWNIRYGYCKRYSEDDHSVLLWGEE
jgi:hypothetical protein